MASLILSALERKRLNAQAAEYERQLAAGQFRGAGHRRDVENQLRITRDALSRHESAKQIKKAAEFTPAPSRPAPAKRFIVPDAPVPWGGGTESMRKVVGWGVDTMKRGGTFVSRDVSFEGQKRGLQQIHGMSERQAHDVARALFIRRGIVDPGEYKGSEPAPTLATKKRELAGKALAGLRAKAAAAAEPAPASPEMAPLNNAWKRLDSARAALQRKGASATDADHARVEAAQARVTAASSRLHYGTAKSRVAEAVQRAAGGLDADLRDAWNAPKSMSDLREVPRALAALPPEQFQRIVRGADGGWRHALTQGKLSKAIERERAKTQAPAATTIRTPLKTATRTAEGKLQRVAVDPLTVKGLSSSARDVVHRIDAKGREDRVRLAGALAEGQMILRTGIKAGGERYTPGELDAVRRSVESTRAKLAGAIRAARAEQRAGKVAQPPVAPRTAEGAGTDWRRLAEVVALQPQMRGIDWSADKAAWKASVAEASAAEERLPHGMRFLVDRVSNGTPLGYGGSGIISKSQREGHRNAVAAEAPKIHAALVGMGKTAEAERYANYWARYGINAKSGTAPQPAGSAAHSAASEKAASLDPDRLRKLNEAKAKIAGVLLATMQAKAARSIAGGFGALAKGLTLDKRIATLSGEAQRAARQLMQTGHSPQTAIAKAIAAHMIQTGPRGGRYYVTAGGTKKYVRPGTLVSAMAGRRRPAK